MLLSSSFFFFFFNDTATTEIYTLSLHDALPISSWGEPMSRSPEMEASEGLLVDYVLGQLDRDEVRALEQRIAAEPEVAREVERLRAVLGLVPYAKAVEPPAHLRAAVLRAAAEARKARRARGRPARSTFGPAAAALLALLPRIDNYPARQELRLQRTGHAAPPDPHIRPSLPLHA